MSYERMTLCTSHSPGYRRDEERQFGHVFREAYLGLKDTVAAFAPTLVVMFGSDHRRAFTDIVPSMSVVFHAEGLGDLKSPTGPYDIPEDKAASLADFLLARGLDIAVTRRVKLDHGFGLTFGDIFGSLDAIPVIPVFINCATFPLADPRRSVELGEAVGAWARTLDERVLFIGSGGLSHNPPTLALVPDGLSEEERQAISRAHREAAKDDIRPEWDEQFLADLGNAASDWTSTVTQSHIDLAGVGANEVRTWLAAYVAGGKPMSKVVYEPVREWITGMGIAVSTDDLAGEAA